MVYREFGNISMPVMHGSGGKNTGKIIDGGVVDEQVIHLFWFEIPHLHTQILPNIITASTQFRPTFSHTKPELHIANESQLQVD
jgi:hypothetical protein